MRILVTNNQRKVAIDTARIARLARCALRILRLTNSGTLSISFISDAQMRAINRRFKGSDRVTDVLSFRYELNGVRKRLPEQMRAVGEILISPSMARAYARSEGIGFTEELSRYVLHGILHWCGHEDESKGQQRKMRATEGFLLLRCGVRTGRNGN